MANRLFASAVLYYCSASGVIQTTDGLKLNLEMLAKKSGSISRGPSPPPSEGYAQSESGASTKSFGSEALSSEEDNSPSTRPKPNTRYIHTMKKEKFESLKKQMSSLTQKLSDISSVFIPNFQRKLTSLIETREEEEKRLIKLFGDSAQLFDNEGRKLIEDNKVNAYYDNAKNIAYFEKRLKIFDGIEEMKQMAETFSKQWSEKAEELKLGKEVSKSTLKDIKELGDTVEYSFEEDDILAAVNPVLNNVLTLQTRNPKNWIDDFNTDNEKKLVERLVEVKIVDGNKLVSATVSDSDLIEYNKKEKISLTKEGVSAFCKKGYKYDIALPIHEEVNYFFKNIKDRMVGAAISKTLKAGSTIWRKWTGNKPAGSFEPDVNAAKKKKID